MIPFHRATHKKETVGGHESGGRIWGSQWDAKEKGKCDEMDGKRIDLLK